jgi:hypothetical protein
MKLALRYTTEKLDDLTFDEEAEYQELFETIKCTEPVVNTTTASGVLLNGRKFNHLLYKHKDFEVIISADELDADKLEFLQGLWGAMFIYASLYKNANWGDYVQIMTDGGKFPLTYIDELEYLPEVPFNFSYAEPV